MADPTKHAPGFEVRLTLSETTAAYDRARRDLARMLRVFAGKQDPALASALWEVAAIFEAGLPPEEPGPPPEK